jgi:hypothetical protein
LTNALPVNPVPPVTRTRIVESLLALVGILLVEG